MRYMNSNSFKKITWIRITFEVCTLSCNNMIRDSVIFMCYNINIVLLYISIVVLLFVLMTRCIIRTRAKNKIYIIGNIFNFSQNKCHLRGGRIVPAPHNPLILPNPSHIPFGQTVSAAPMETFAYLKFLNWTVLFVHYPKILNIEFCIYYVHY